MPAANSPAPINLPQPPQSWNAGWQQRYTQALTLASSNWLSKGNDILLDANTKFTLTSPDGTTQVTIVANDDGTIGPTPAFPASLLGQNNTWTGTNTFDALTTFNTRVDFVTLAAWQQPTAPTNQQYSDIALDGSGQPNFRLVNDAYSAATSWMYVSRSGTTATGITLQATDITLNGVVFMPDNTATAAQIMANPASPGGAGLLVAVDQLWAAAGVYTIPGPDGSGNFPMDCSKGSNFFYGTGHTASTTYYFQNFKSGQSGIICIPAAGQQIYVSFGSGITNIWTPNGTNNTNGSNNYTTTPFQAPGFTWLILSYCIVAPTICVISMVANA